MGTCAVVSGQFASGLGEPVSVLLGFALTTELKSTLVTLKS